jgi:serine/threonine protein kinase
MRGATYWELTAMSTNASLDVSLSSRIQNNHIWDQQTKIVTEVKKLEPLPLRKKWMNDLAQAVAFLESFNIAHGDLRPENILLDRDRLKLSDFDCTAEIGTDFEACMAPYGRLLSGNETNQGRRGNSGFLGPRTEQFALSSVYYLINYGFEVYGDRCLAEDPKEHGPKVVELLQNMKFPNLYGDPMIDKIIERCWHNKYATVAELSAHMETLLTEGTDGEETNAGIANTKVANGRELNTSSCDDLDPDHSTEDFSLKKAFCLDLEKHGLLQLLSSGEPEQLGFTFDLYRHTS